MYAVLAGYEIQVNAQNHRRLVADYQRDKIVRTTTSTEASRVLTVIRNVPGRSGARGLARAIANLLARPNRQPVAEIVDGASQLSI